MVRDVNWFPLREQREEVIRKRGQSLRYSVKFKKYMNANITEQVVNWLQRRN